MKEYNEVVFYGTIFSGTLLLHLISKLLFNLFAEIRIPLDKWTVIDLVCAFFNIICFNVISNASPESIVDRTRKQ